MPGFVKPTRKVVNIEDAFGELIGKKLIKDLHDNEEICPVCHGTGLRIEDNPYGLSDDPDKRAGQFPYKHQSIQFCPNCYNGVVRFCPDCGKQIPRYRTLCDCDAVVQRRQQDENRKEKERLEKAEKHEPNALGSLFTMAQSDFYSHNEGYFSCWEDFFDSWNEDREEFTEKPLYVWGTEEVEMSSMLQVSYPMPVRICMKMPMMTLEQTLLLRCSATSTNGKRNMGARPIC